MERLGDWRLLDEIEDDGPITEQAARNVRDSADPGCLICAVENDSEWDDE